MFDPTSRYYGLGNLVYTPAGGQPTVYRERRFPPQATTLPLLVEVVVGPRDRFDLIAWRTLGNSELFWRICDANDVLNPVDALEPGATLRVARPLP
jgi:hypothetical protein